ncbi:DsrE family protein [Sediminibacterium sp.]|uniref:DsrE family protein n=1 Tax=Sediminibacterium sp. TaxID=1917865 RepID=UPI003F7201FB
MKPIFIAVALVFSCILVNAQNVVHPLIPFYGPVTEIPFALDIMDKKGEYKVLVDITSPSANAKEISEFFENIARIANLHIAGGVSPKKLHVVAVVHGAAVPFIVNNETYKQKFGVDNPNLPLFTAIKKAGIPLFVCGQTLFKRKVDPTTLAPEFETVLSAITTVTTYVNKGYVFLKF